MHIYIFSGKVFPERANVEITEPIKINIPNDQSGIKGQIIISITCSQISVFLDLENSFADLETLKNTVEHLVRTFIDAYGYLSGRGYDVEITSVVTPTGEQIIFGVGIKGIEDKKTERPVVFNDLVKIIGSSPSLHIALASLREAIRSPLDTGFFCFRAIEALRQNFINDDDKEDSESWVRMGKALLIDKSWTKELADNYAFPQRHGAIKAMTGDERLAAMDCAWKVMDRYLLFLNNGGKPLIGLELFEK